MAITVVNMIPQSLSGETNQDSEPNLAVNPNSPLQIAASAFTPNPTGGSFAPIFVSSDGGQTWALNAIVPGATSSFPTFDITLKFGGTSNVLYGGIIRADNTNLAILRTTNYVGTTPMTVLLSRAPAASGAIDDQPWVQATTASGVTGTPDRVYVGSNDQLTSPKSAHIDQSQDAATAAPPAGFSTAGITIASRSAAGGQDGPSVRPTIHSSGRIYAAYFNWTAFSSASNITADVVVCRDDNWGSGGSPYTALVDSGDLLPGVRVVTGVTIPWRNSSFLGQERVGSHLSIAVDPTNSSVVYLAWCDGVSPYTIHVRKSTDGGVTWSADLRVISSGLNPALAVNASGHVGFLYQTLTTGGTRWETHCEISNNGFATAPTPIVLANTPSATPVATFHPYLGDYIYLTAIGTTFYGIFSANNTPDNANFPNGVKYQRNANFTTHQLLNVDNQTPVAVSIDPFFFSVTDVTFPPIHPIQPPIHPIQPPIHPIQPPIHPIQPPIHPIQPPIHPIQPPIHPIQPPIHPIQPPIEPVQPIEGTPPVPKKPAKPT
jgi:hypothetical protein